MNKKLINGASLFSSAGIGELYLHKYINFKVANEVIPKRAEYYKFFYPETKMITGDITNKNIQKKILSSLKGNNIKFLLMTPPCQGLSSVGKNKVQSEFIKDKRNFLILQSFKFIDDLDLDYILIENVPRFLKMYFPYDHGFYLLKDILKKRYGHKYNVDIRILNAKYYGVGQSRPRAIIKLFKKGLKWPWPTKSKIITLKQSIGYLPSLKPGEKSNIKWHYAKKVRPDIAVALEHTPTGKSALKNKKYYPRKKNGQRVKGFHNAYARMRWDMPASARTTYSGSVSSQNNVHPGRKLANGLYSDPRVLSLLETFIVSSIPKDIQFPKGTSDTFIRTLVGEAIPPRMLFRICFPKGANKFGY